MMNVIDMVVAFKFLKKCWFSLFRKFKRHYPLNYHQINKRRF